MISLHTSAATLSYRIVTDDDTADVDDAVGLGGIVITGLSSTRPGDASLLLQYLIDLHADKRISLVAFAASGDHERLYRLYAKFGFVEGCLPSLRVRAVNL